MKVFTEYRNLGDNIYLVKDKETKQPYIMQLKYTGFGICEKHLLEISKDEFLTIWLS